MYVTQEQLLLNNVPLVHRDYCAHLYIDLQSCKRLSAFPWPWECKLPKAALDKCQYDEMMRRVRIFEAEKRKKDEERREKEKDAALEK